ncbi:CAP domain [Phytophthora cactorum]|nr:CAP domain [Phytophthora cactorum]
MTAASRKPRVHDWNCTELQRNVCVGTSSPIVERLIFMQISFFHMLWPSMIAREKIGSTGQIRRTALYRSSLRSNVIEVLQRRCWSVRGLALNIFQDAGKERVSLMYSLESKVLLSGLRSPRGLAMDSTNQILFFNEKTGRIFQVRLGKTMTARQKASILPDDASIVSPGVTSLAILFAISATSTDADVSGNLRHESRTLQAKYTSTSQYAASMLASVNAQRAAQGLPALCMNAKLMAASMRHSTDMAVNNFMSHTGSDGSTMSMRVTAAGYKWTRVAENVAAGQSSVAAVMTSWMNSPGHRANILGDYTMFGTA